MTFSLAGCTGQISPSVALFGAYIPSWLICVAGNALRAALESHKAASALASAASTTYDAALAAYRNGVGTVTVADSGLLDARQAQADALIGAADLAFVVGAMTSGDAFTAAVQRQGSIAH
ncbi:hypothetical protein EZH22_08985 [Xanthobacter dioxanivorans]|uniref:Uncharacterized protein n=1 Tax=Xanthobacter dioxanivorans TaxID=2528964 RepID=A0A974PRI9_9HYPH|nr:hypothetical protein [Xanthobacter dioxanivorans]QRG08402.1 hypothetical protein EZH22_08985 [Xanthobacter dioxanivorans]